MEGESWRGSRRIRRNRTIYSCFECRKRKIKCDKGQPICGNCSRSGDRCVYAEEAAEPSSHLSNLSGLLGSEYTATTAPKRRRGPITEDWDDPAPTIEGVSGEADRTTSSKENLEARLDKLTFIVERLSRQKSDSRSSGSHLADEEPGVAESSEPPSPSDLVESGNLGHLSKHDLGRTRYVGNTYWAYVADEIGELNQLLKDDVRFDHPDTLPPVQSSVQHGKSSENSPSSGDTSNPSLNLVHRSNLLRSGNGHEARYAPLHDTIYDGLPSQRQCNILYRCFITGVHSVYVLVDPMLLLSWYNEFWEWYRTRHETRQPYSNPNFVPLLYALLHAGALSCPMKVIDEEFDEESRIALAARMNDKVIQVLTAQSFLRSPHLAGLIAYIIVQTMSMKEEGLLISGMSFSLTLQVCQSLGLHREPTKFGISSRYSEVRRRVWHHIVWLDALLFTTSGWPPLVCSEVYWDVESASELRDDLISTPEGNRYLDAVTRGTKMPDRCDDPVYGQLTSHVNPVHVLCQGKIKVASCLRKVSKVLLGMKPIGPKEFMWCVELLKPLEKDLEDRISRIPDPYGHGRSDAYPPAQIPTSKDSLWQWYSVIPTDDMKQEDLDMLRNSWVAFHSFARKWMKMLIDKAYCLLHKPFLRNPNRTLWTSVRDAVLPHAHGYLSDFLHLATNAEYQPFHWAWPGAHQPLHAMMVTLVDLYEHPLSPQAVHSRALIDRTFEVTTLDGGITSQEEGVQVFREEGRAAWRLLRNLREKAWKKAGLDPDYLWKDELSGSEEQSGSPEEAMTGTAADPQSSECRGAAETAFVEADFGSPAGFGSGSRPEGSTAGAQQPDLHVPPTQTTTGASTTLANTPAAEAGATAGPANTSGQVAAVFNWEEWDAVFGNFKNLAEDMELDFGEMGEGPPQ